MRKGHQKTFWSGIGKLNRIWKSSNISLRTKVLVYEALVYSGIHVWFRVLDIDEM